MRKFLPVLILMGSLSLMGGEAFAQESEQESPAIFLTPDQEILEGITEAPAGRVSSAIEIAIVLTLLTLLPSILMTLTSFMRIMIVLSFVKRAMGTQELPPRHVVAGLAFFLTLFVMYPTVSEIYDGAVEPYMAGESTLASAGGEASTILKDFLLRSARENDLGLFLDLANMEPPETPEQVPLHIVIPSFILSELRTAFQMGFIIFLPFLVIDLVISSILLSMGMFMLPPVMISTPFKILLFVLVDGWNLILSSLVKSFA